MDCSEQFICLWTVAQPRVASLISGAVPDFQQGQDMLRSVALSCLRKFGEYDSRRPFVEWALEIARCEILSQQPKYPASFSCSNDRQRL
jgi:RNA polymerase sigma-70 factor, ECF subfamily